MQEREAPSALDAARRCKVAARSVSSPPGAVNRGPASLDGPSDRGTPAWGACAKARGRRPAHLIGHQLEPLSCVCLQSAESSRLLERNECRDVRGSRQVTLPSRPGLSPAPPHRKTSDERPANHLRRVRRRIPVQRCRAALPIPSAAWPRRRSGASRAGKRDARRWATEAVAEEVVADRRASVGPAVGSAGLAAAGVEAAVALLAAGAKAAVATAGAGVEATATVAEDRRAGAADIANGGKDTAAPAAVAATEAGVTAIAAPARVAVDTAAADTAEALRAAHALRAAVVAPITPRPGHRPAAETPGARARAKEGTLARRAARNHRTGKRPRAPRRHRVRARAPSVPVTTPSARNVAFKRRSRSSLSRGVGLLPTLLPRQESPRSRCRGGPRGRR